MWWVLYLVALGLLALFSFVQLLYLESMRLRSREFPSLGFFKEAVQEAIGLASEDAALSFTLYKHSLLVALGVLGLLINQDGDRGWMDALQGVLLAVGSMAIFSYLLPQMLYRRSGGHFLLPLAKPLRWSAYAMRPLGSMLTFLETLAEISQPAENLEEPASPQEEIEALIAAGEEEGLIEEGDKKLIQSVVAFGDKRVREVMTPKPNIVAIEGSATTEDFRMLVIREQFSRVPVYDGNLDNITGFVHAKDLFAVEYKDRGTTQVSSMQRPVPFVPETKLVTDLLREMQRTSNHMAIVVDEYGNTAGLATMEDLVEEILGEIRDEHEPGHDYMEREPGVFVLAGSFDLDHLKDLVGFQPPEGLEATTAGGLATEWFGRVPKAGESIEQEGVLLTVLASDERRVIELEVKRSSAESDPSLTEQEEGQIEGTE
ncbi:MAG: hemolysin family protein [Bryobacter sp.]|nr:hemolysin family protein [Bryobacter sp.]